jgi:uncharacterized membrane protein
MAATTHTRFARALRHFRIDSKDVSRAFGDDGFARIETAIAQSEASHGAEICFAVEASLDLYRVWAGHTPRQRAQVQFAELGVWDTEANNGVLIYLLMADRAVEIIVDRQARHKVPTKVWLDACEAMRQNFQKERFVDGVLAGLALIQPALVHAFPRLPSDLDEISNKVQLIR